MAAWLVVTRWMPSIEEPTSAPGAPKPVAVDSAYTLTTWSEILRSGRFWGLIVSSITYNPCYYFYSTWLPTYFVQQRGVPFGTELGRLMMVPYIGFGIGSILRRLARDLAQPPRLGRPPLAQTDRVDRRVVNGAESSPCPTSTDMTAVLAIIFLMAVSLGAWISQYLSALQDVSERQVSSVSGIIGAFGAFAGALGMWGVGIITSKPGGFVPVFIALSVMPVVATLGIVVPRWPYGCAESTGADYCQSRPIFASRN